MSLKSGEKAKRNRWKRKNFQTDLKYQTKSRKGGKISSTQATWNVQEPSGCEAPELTSGTGSSPWMVHREVPPSALSEAAAAPEHHHNVLSYCPSLMMSTPETWNLDCWPAENDCKHGKKSPQISQKNSIRSGCNALTTVNRLTRATRSCSCSGPAHSQPWWSRSGSGAAPNDIYRHHLSVGSPPKNERGKKNCLWPSRGESPQSASWCVPVLLWGCSEKEHETAKLQKCCTPHLHRRDRYFKPVSSQILQLLKQSQKQSFNIFQIIPSFYFSYKQRWQESKRRKKNNRILWHCCPDMFLWITLGGNCGDHKVQKKILGLWSTLPSQ